MHMHKSKSINVKNKHGYKKYSLKKGKKIEEEGKGGERRRKGRNGKGERERKERGRKEEKKGKRSKSAWPVFCFKGSPCRM